MKPPRQYRFRYHGRLWAWPPRPGTASFVDTHTGKRYGKNERMTAEEFCNPQPPAEAK